MKVHANAPLGPKGRLTMVRRVVDERWSLTQAAEATGVSDRSCSKWVLRPGRTLSMCQSDTSSADDLSKLSRRCSRG